MGEVATTAGRRLCYGNRFHRFEKLHPVVIELRLQRATLALDRVPGRLFGRLRGGLGQFEAKYLMTLALANARRPAFPTPRLPPTRRAPAARTRGSGPDERRPEVGHELCLDVGHRQRMAELGVAHVIQGAEDKVAALDAGTRAAIWLSERI